MSICDCDDGKWKHVLINNIVFGKLKWEVIVSFVDNGEIVDHQKWQTCPH
jgi:hypothetical protein